MLFWHVDVLLPVFVCAQILEQVIRPQQAVLMWLIARSEGAQLPKSEHNSMLRVLHMAECADLAGLAATALALYHGRQKQ